MAVFRKLLFFVVTLVVASGLFAPTSSWAAPADEEVLFVKDINALRASRGIAPMSVHPMLTVLARNFAAQMAARGNIFHNPELSNQAPGEWIKLGENVGVGGSEPSLHKAFMDSPGHMRNLLDPEYKYVGIGVLVIDSRMWVVEDFMRSDAPLPQVSPPKTAITEKSDMATRFGLAVRGIRR